MLLYGKFDNVFEIRLYKKNLLQDGQWHLSASLHLA
jgi:hypothetical protein